jgi:phage baseplate assembly protein gpV
MENKLTKWKRWSEKPKGEERYLSSPQMDEFNIIYVMLTMQNNTHKNNI